MQQMLSFTEENYLKAIFHLAEEHEDAVSTNGLAESLNTKPATVSDMIKKLARKEFVDYKKYQGVNLTSSGRTAALKVIRKHRLWEVFLVDKLHFNWDEVHEIAEQLEHVNSPILVERLNEFLGNPKVDPHGDPIPDVNGDFQTGPKILLSEMDTNESGVIIGVSDGEPKLLQYLDKVKIRLGLKIMVLDKIEFDGSIQIQYGEASPLFLSATIAKHLTIRKL
ncbi:MAG: metal-dependent transcriptional regulator [Cytophagales bacterium]|nr:metal-dependent transcriptional regulator [Cytophagales bacterium]